MFLLCFESTGTNLFIKDSMENNSRFERYYASSVIFYFFLYFTFALFGALVYGNSINKIVFLNLTHFS